MGVDTQIITAYGFLLKIEDGILLRDSIENGDLCYDDEDFIKGIEFGSDAYDDRNTQMFIYIQSTCAVLLYRKTGGRGGFGESIGAGAMIEEVPEEQKAAMEKFSQWVQHNLEIRTEIDIDYHIYFFDC